MTYTLTSLSVAVATLLTILSLAAAECNDTILFECDDFTDLNEDIRNHKTVYNNPSSLDTACESAGGLMSCLDNSGCQDYQNGFAKRFANMLTYICADEQKSVYKAKISCTTNQETRLNISVCTDELDHHQHHDKSSCEHADEKYKCIHEAVMADCGHDIAVVYEKSMRYVDDPCTGGSNVAVTTLMTSWLAVVMATLIHHATAV